MDLFTYMVFYLTGKIHFEVWLWPDSGPGIIPVWNFPGFPSPAGRGPESSSFIDLDPGPGFFNFRAPACKLVNRSNLAGCHFSVGSGHYEYSIKSVDEFAFSSFEVLIDGEQTS